MAGKRVAFWRRIWPSGQWVEIQAEECATEAAAAWIARCRGHLPPGEPLPYPQLEEVVARAVRAEARVVALAEALAEADREIAHLRAALARAEASGVPETTD